MCLLISSIKLKTFNRTNQTTNTHLIDLINRFLSGLKTLSVPMFYSHLIDDGFFVELSTHVTVAPAIFSSCFTRMMKKPKTQQQPEIISFNYSNCSAERSNSKKAYIAIPFGRSHQNLTQQNKSQNDHHSVSSK